MMQYINLHTLGNLRPQNRKHQGAVPLWEPAEHLHGKHVGSSAS